MAVKNQAIWAVHTHMAFTVGLILQDKQNRKDADLCLDKTPVI